MSRKVRDAWSVSLLTASALASAVCAFAVQAALARNLTPMEFGNFTSAMAVLALIAPAVGFGLPAYWLKLFGTEGWAAFRWMTASLRFVLCTSLSCIAAAIVWAYVQSTGVRNDIFMMLPVVLAQAAIEMAAARFQIEERFGYVAIWQVLQNGSRIALLIVCSFVFVRSEFIALGFGAIAAITTAGAWFSLVPLLNGKANIVGHGVRPASSAAPCTGAEPSMSVVWRGAMPFGVASLLFFAYGQSGIIVLTHLGTAREVASYSVAVTILSGLYLGPNVLFQKLLMPRLHRWAALGDEKLMIAWRRGNIWMLVLGVLLAVITALAAPFYVPVIFGGKYFSSVPVVILMAVCVPFRFLTTSTSSIMTTSNLLKVRNLCALAAIAASIAAAFALIPFCGVKGAAWSAVIGEAVWSILSISTARYYLPRMIIKNAMMRQRSIDKTLDQSVIAPSVDACAGFVATAVDAMASVSVIIPCFNCSSTIERALESLAHQRLRPKEVILVDDCSTDDTPEQLKKLAGCYEAGWVRVIELERNSGPGRARNIGWENASQPYIAFLDSDDAWDLEKLEIQYGWMIRHPHVAITGHPVAQIDEAAGVVARVLPKVDEPKPTSRWRVLFSNRFTPSSIVMRSDCVARFDESKRHAEDYFMLLEVFLVDEGIGYLFSTPLSYVFKAQFGAETGLSAQLWKIQKGEQDNYRRFWKSGAINWAEWVCFSLLSAAKYLRRCAVARKIA
ncbi:glycosyltransferase [Burkholderia sp. Ax-1719]|uniref:glycosyltransferase n=1 Tax=Burkholderia sp. Ax-1719 TaxID=2608334 RepID=UPI00141DF3EB|nr:glycosyltransferase [Burkholderia sp. Ax-1719]NIE67000.1 glycosyltransferase [Burkholderia sp. Ax-1719]